MHTNQANRANDVATAWKAAAATVLDVRPELEQGGEPFVRIMEAAERIPAGASLVIVAPFEPTPLYGALGGRGFSYVSLVGSCVVAFLHLGGERAARSSTHHC